MHRTGKTYVYELDGLGRKMPVTFACFTVAGLSLMGIPLFAGFTELGMRSFAAIYLAHVMGYKGIFYASPIAWFGAAMVVMIGYVITIYKLKGKKSKNYFKDNYHKIKLAACINCVNQNSGE